MQAMLLSTPLSSLIPILFIYRKYKHLHEIYVFKNLKYIYIYIYKKKNYTIL